MSGALAFVTLMAATFGGQGTMTLDSTVPDIPENHRLYEVYSELETVDLVPHRLAWHNPGPLRRREFGEAILTTFQRLEDRLKRLDDLGSPRPLPLGYYAFVEEGIRQAVVRIESRRFRHEIVPRLLLIDELAHEFQGDLNALGYGNQAIRLRLLRIQSRVTWLIDEPAATAKPKFSDLLTTHWATESIDHLRKIGVLQGYPNGTFTRP